VRLSMLLVCVPSLAAAQTAPAGLRERMDAFAAALREQEPMMRIASFFQREGEWELVRTPNRVAPGAAVVRTRFAAGTTQAAISEGGEVCESFGGVTGDVGAYEGTLVSQAHTPRRWRYVGHHRFVPPGAVAESPIFVEWIRENGSWVITRIGEEYGYMPRVIGRTAMGAVTRDTTAGNALPLERRVARGHAWFEGSGPVDVDGHWYYKYGLPRRIEAGLVARFGSIGMVPVFVEAPASPQPEVMYVLTGHDEYQPYMPFGHSICRS
jgi:hypothetical protein